MGFLAPGFLIGILAIGLPLWLHLLNLSKHDPQPFSSLMFFERRVHSSAKQRRLRYWLLLALRLALLLLLALAFAAPYIFRTAAVTGRRKLTMIAVDRSFSMRHGRRMAEARRTAEGVLNALPGSARVQVVTLGEHMDTLTPPEMNRDDLRAAIRRIDADDSAASFGEFARALRSTEQSTRMDLDVHLVSDMQQTAMPANFRDLQVGPHVALTLHRVGGQNAPNWAVETVAVARRVDPGEPTHLNATVTGWNTPAAARTASLVLDDRVVASTTVNVAANGRAAVKFDGFDVPYGAHRGSIRVEPHDDLPQDDSYNFSVEKSDARKVLLLYAANRARQTFYYRTALESGTRHTLMVDALPVENAHGQDFSKYAFVVLSDVGDLGSSLADALCRYVKNGGAALIALGENTVQAGRIPLSSDHVSNGGNRQDAGYVDSSHPALAGAGRFENVQFSEPAVLVAKSNERVLARFAGGSPLLIEERMGEGRELIFASALDNSASDFVLHASFVPFVVQTASYLAGTEDAPSSVVAGTPIVLRHSRDQTTAADVVGPAGQHELSLAESTQALFFDPQAAGFYEIVRADGHHLLAAVHTDRRESDLRTIPDETLNLWRNTGSTGASGEAVGVHEQTVRWSFWRYVLGAALLAALLESILADRYLKEGRRAA